VGKRDCDGGNYMRARIIRHGKVDFQWRKYSTSEQFDRDCKMYDDAPIFPLISGEPNVDYQNIYISSLQRTKETANQLFGEKDFATTKLIDEVPLCASIVSNIKLPIIFWNVSGRLQWFLNIPLQKESRKETIYRATQFIKMIVEKDNDCIIVTHGFFMHTLLRQMKKQGFRISHSRLSYSNGECVIAER
jgi:broad specificity phosphatase PhoE